MENLHILDKQGGKWCLFYKSIEREKLFIIHTTMFKYY